MGCHVGFDLIRYENEFCLAFLAKCITKYQSQTILGSGLQYKTDLKKFGGQGLALEHCLDFMNQFEDKKNI